MSIHIPLPKPAAYKKVVVSVSFQKLHKAHFKNKSSWVWDYQRLSEIFAASWAFDFFFFFFQTLSYH